MWLNSYFPFFDFTKLKDYRKLAKAENAVEFQNTFVNLVNQDLQRYSLKNLPPTCNERYFKLALLFGGEVGIIKDKELGYLTLGISYTGAEYNIYGETNTVDAYGWNGFNKTYIDYIEGANNENAECVVCFDNDAKYPYINYIYAYARRLADGMRTIDVCARKLKNPYFITADETQKNSIEKILADIESNQDKIITTKATNPNQFQVLQTGVNPGVIATLWNQRVNVQSEIRSLLGIKSAANLDKAERLIVSEAESDNQSTLINRDLRLRCLQERIDIANKHFGLNIQIVDNYEKMEDKANAKLQNNVGAGREKQQQST